MPKYFPVAARKILTLPKFFIFLCIHPPDSQKSCRRRLEGHSLQVRDKQNWDRGFILLLPQVALLPGSDAGSDIVKPASSFVI